MPSDEQRERDGFGVNDVGLGADSLSHQAYQRLRDQIVTLQLAPGSPLRETALRRELGLGRTPIREALQSLAGQGLVVLRPRLGAYVADISLTDLQQIFELREELEAFAARLAAERAQADDLLAMQQALFDLEGLEPRELRDRRFATDRRFHGALAGAAHNKYIQDALGRLYNLNVRMWYLVWDRVGPIPSGLDEHRQVLEAIRRHDVAGAAAAIQGHIRGFHEQIRAVL